MGDLTNNFSRDEFVCECGCGEDDISLLLVHKLEHMRHQLGTPITVISGCRCKAHNKQYGGKEEHEKGEGADLAVDGSYHAYRLVQAAYAAGFERIGFGKSPNGNLQMHVGVSATLPHPVLWGY